MTEHEKADGDTANGAPRGRMRLRHGADLWPLMQALVASLNAVNSTVMLIAEQFTDEPPQPLAPRPATPIARPARRTFGDRHRTTDNSGSRQDATPTATTETEDNG